MNINVNVETREIIKVAQVISNFEQNEGLVFDSLELLTPQTIIAMSELPLEERENYFILAVSVESALIYRVDNIQTKRNNVGDVYGLLADAEPIAFCNIFNNVTGMITDKTGISGFMIADENGVLRENMTNRNSFDDKSLEIKYFAKISNINDSSSFYVTTEALELLAKCQ